MTDSICSGILLFCCLLLCGSGWVAACLAEEPLNFINIYGAQITANTWDDFLSSEEVCEQNSFLLARSLGRRIGSYRDLALGLRYHF